ncbi:MAG: YciI family protein, partial [Candidatus Limnocylindrales bacterium]
MLTQESSMQYLALIYTEEVAVDDADLMNPETLAAYNRFGDEAKRRNAMLAGEALMPTSMATTVRVRDGQTLTTDGPFAETKEALGGFYMLECKDLDEAIELAAMIPGASVGCVEVRP